MRTTSTPIHWPALCGPPACLSSPRPEVGRRPTQHGASAIIISACSASPWPRRNRTAQISSKSHGSSRVSSVSARATAIPGNGSNRARATPTLPSKRSSAPLLHSRRVRRTPLFERISAAFLWIAAFCLATGVFFSLTLLFKYLPPTDPVAIGVVTIQRYAKIRDYLGAVLFFLLVPPVTVWLRGVLGRYAKKHRSPFLFAVPYFFVPFFYLTTGKVGWILLLPIVLSFAAPQLLNFVRTRSWIRELFRPELGGYHGLLFAE